MLLQIRDLRLERLACDATRHRETLVEARRGVVPRTRLNVA
jgi:hypothetical protein